jgi:hypothetical protein
LDLREWFVGKRLHIPRSTTGEQNDSMRGSGSNDAPLDHIKFIRAAFFRQGNPCHFDVRTRSRPSRPATSQQSTTDGKPRDAAEQDLFYGKIPEF